MMGEPFGVQFIFSIFPILFFIIFTIVIGSFFVMGIKGMKQYKRNNASPVLTVEARVVAKRTHVRGRAHHHGMDDGMMHTNYSGSTTYFATFEVESGDRLELAVDGREYGMLAEGDHGKLTFQGTRYQSFVR